MICTNGIKNDDFKSTKYITDNLENLKYDFHIFLKKEDSQDPIIA